MSPGAGLGAARVPSWAALGDRSGVRGSGSGVFPSRARASPTPLGSGAAAPP